MQGLKVPKELTREKKTDSTGVPYFSVKFKFFFTVKNRKVYSMWYIQS